MSRSSEECIQLEFVRALMEAKDYLEFCAERSGFQDDEHYLSVRNYIAHVIKEIYQ